MVESSELCIATCGPRKPVASDTTPSRASLWARSYNSVAGLRVPVNPGLRIAALSEMGHGAAECVLLQSSPHSSPKGVTWGMKLW